MKNHSKAAKTHPKNDYSFNLRKTQKQRFSFLFGPLRWHGGLIRWKIQRRKQKAVGKKKKRKL